MPTKKSVTSRLPSLASINLVGVGDSHFFDDEPKKGKKAPSIPKLLDSKFDKDKLEAMKKLVAMMTLGRDVSKYFAEVVKNVVVQNSEVKKLVYMYVIHHAADNQEMALLSINSFQKDQKSDNPRTRANAVNAMSSLRVPVVTPLVVLSLKQGLKDPSPYVRKAVAHSIPKVLQLDPTQHDALIKMVKELLADASVLVLGGAMFAYSEICPEQFELLHGVVARLCHLLADMDYWSQTLALTVLTRYGRTQFPSPFLGKSAAKSKKSKRKQSTLSDFYSDGDSDREQEDSEEEEDEDEYEMHDDHRAIIKAASTLLCTRCSSVCLAASSLLFYLAPEHEVVAAGPNLVTFIKRNKEVRYLMLANIATMAATRPSMFSSCYKEFFISTSDTLAHRKLKLDILTNLASSTNISVILQEFQAYVLDHNAQFVQDVIQAIGRCATRLPDVAEACMRGLMVLVSSSKNADVVASSVVVMRTLLQTDPAAYKRIISSLAKVLKKTDVPMARAAIVWIVGEYRDMIPSRAPDILRELLKGFVEEELQVRYQVLNMATKLFMSNPTQTSLLFKYTLDLCKYDQSYDLRDRARMVRGIFLSRKKKKSAIATDTTAQQEEAQKQLKSKLQLMFLTEKPTPEMRSSFEERERFVLGSVSHSVTHAVNSYTPLPDFPEQLDETGVQQRAEAAEERRLKKMGWKERQELQDKSDKKKSGKKKKSDKKKKAKKQRDEDDLDSFFDSDAEEEESSEEESDSGDDSDFDDESDGAFSSMEEYSTSDDSEEESDSDEDDSEESDSDDDSDDSESEESDSDESEESESESEEEQVKPPSRSPKQIIVQESADESDEEFETVLSDDVVRSPLSPSAKQSKSKGKDKSELNTFSLEDEEQPVAAPSKKSKKSKKSAPPPKEEDLLADLVSIAHVSSPSPSPSPSPSNAHNNNAELDLLSSDLAGMSVVGASSNTSNGHGQTSFSSPRPSFLVLDSSRCGGVCVRGCWSRSASVYGASFLRLDLTLENKWDEDITDVHVKNAELAAGQTLREFDTIASIPVRQTVDATLHVDLGKKTSVSFELEHSRGVFTVSLEPSVLDCIRPQPMTRDAFLEKIAHFPSMNEQLLSVPESLSPAECTSRVVAGVNVAIVCRDDQEETCLSGVLPRDGSAVLVSVSSTGIRVIAEEFMLSSQLGVAVKSLLS